MIRKAKIRDVLPVKRLIEPFARQRVILPVSLNMLYRSLRDFWVMESSGEIVACCALKIFWKDLGEIRTLVVKKEDQGKGLGSSMVSACIEEARDIELREVFALTYVPEFFEKLGFKEVEKSSLPHKIWEDCINCPYFPECREIAMTLHL